MKQKKIDNQIADVVKEIVKFTNVGFNGYMNKPTPELINEIKDFFTERIGEIYSRGYDDGVNSERSGRNYK